MINNAVLVGRLTKDIELKKTPNNVSTCTFTLACNRRFTNSEGQQTADFINCVAWRQSADFLSQYANKGSIVGVEGRIQTRNYDDNKGNKVYVTEIIAERVQLLSNKKNNEQKPSYEPAYEPEIYQQPLGSSIASANDREFERGQARTLDIASDDLPFY